ALYDQARLFLYPSLYEGFGLPILEAFHHGTPVITSNNSGMTEVAGNAAVLVDPLEFESIRDGITTILQEDQATEKIRDQRMILRLQMFRWEDTARQTLSVYQKTKQYWQT
ncbi:glycosyltransferase, partial [Candidatus Woesebacteria bacterium]|nr:glycosyltransferase [Candidatus Woesebacteria bacterium]